MADYTVEIDSFPDHKKGDKWNGIDSIGPILINGSQPAVTLDRIRMQFRIGADFVYRLDSDADQPRDAPISIDNATTWEASVPEVGVFLNRSGTWDWDMEFWGTGWEGPLTLYKGSQTVFQDVTR